jgi:hypothetical protein
MSSKRAVLIILVASLTMLAAGAGPRGSGAARALPPVEEPVTRTLTIPYPGRLSDQSGQPVVDGAYDFTFALYAAETGGDPLWSEVQERIEVLDGGFLTSLGSIHPIPASLLEGGRTVWLAAGVRGPGEAEFTTLVPRQQLSASVPKAPDSSIDAAACPHDHFGEQWIGTGSDGLLVSTDNWLALEGWSDNYIGVAGISTPYSVVWPSGRQYGVFGYSYSDHGIYGRTNGDWSYHSGVYGEASQEHAHGVTGWNTGGGIGVYGFSETGDAGYFAGPVEVTGYLYKTGGGFKIDHPLNPENQYLYHSFVESPDMKNVYDGVVTLDADGTAWVELPEWFEAVNKDFRYQRTPIGAPAPDLYIAREIEGNRFRIAGGQPGLKVSWQVTGIRHDAYAEAHPLAVEEAKPPEEQGTYLHPTEQGKPWTEGVDYQRSLPPEQAEAGGE